MERNHLIHSSEKPRLHRTTLRAESESHVNCVTPDLADEFPIGLHQYPYSLS